MTYRARAITALIVGTLMTLLLLSWPIAAHYGVKGRLERYQARLKAVGEKMAVGELVPNLSAADISAANALDRTAAQLPPLSSNSPPLMKLTSPGRALVAGNKKHSRMATSATFGRR